MKKNLIFLTIDQCRVDRLKIHPIFKKLKAYGVFCDNLITYAPYTIASMHSVFSGVYGNKNGVDGYYQYKSFKDDKIFTMPEYFKSEGYFTVGDFINEMTFPKKGWDVFAIHDEYNDNLIKRHKDLISEYLKNKKTFLYLHYSNIHTEMVINVFKKIKPDDAEYFSKIKENTARYDEYVMKAGNYLEEIWKHIEKDVLSGNTILCIISDHGVGLGEKIGEKGYGVYTYDYTLKVFQYLIAPGLLPQNTQYKHQLRTIDILPSMLELLNFKHKDMNVSIEGKSFIQQIKNNSDDNRISYSETGGLEGPHPSPYKHNIKCIRTSEWKLIYNVTTKERFLYNIKKDKEEKNDLSKKYPQITMSLWKELLAHQ